MSPPRWVTDRASPRGAELDRLVEGGWRIDDGFALPTDPWDLTDRRWVRTGTVADDDDVALVVLAAARGVGVMAGCADERRRDQLVDDLQRIGPVEVVLRGPDPLAALDDDQRALLDALAAGSSMGEAAAALHLSGRTAERRLATARKALGVRTTAEAIALATS